MIRRPLPQSANVPVVVSISFKHKRFSDAIENLIRDQGNGYLLITDHEYFEMEEIYTDLINSNLMITVCIV
jgi:hypothetical protein